jgi:hypothetical protein
MRGRASLIKDKFVDRSKQKSALSAAASSIPEPESRDKYAEAVIES